MHNPSFQLNKIRRLIRTHGQTFLFENPKKNAYGEPTEEKDTYEIRGVLHEETSYLSRSTGESATVRKKSSTMILATWESVYNIIGGQEKLTLNGKHYRINGIKNLYEANLVADISLEEVLSGGTQPKV